MGKNSIFYQLRRPDLQRVWPHDVLLIDEAQDMNPAMLDIFAQQKTPKVLVGDPNQQVRSFIFASTQSGKWPKSFSFLPNCNNNPISNPAGSTVFVLYKYLKKEAMADHIATNCLLKRFFSDLLVSRGRQRPRIGRIHADVLPHAKLQIRAGHSICR